jgi:hypothetical protein
MTSCIRRSIGDTDPIQWLLKEKVLGSDRSTPVVLTGKTVYITLVDSNIEPLVVESKYTFDSTGDRDQYFVGNPDELMDGLVTQVIDPTTGIVTQYRYRNLAWHTDVTTVIEDKLCTVVSATSGSISYAPTVAEMCRSGMYHVYFRVSSPVGGESEDTYETKYPRGDSLWIHIMDIFNDF